LFFPEFLIMYSRSIYSRIVAILVLTVATSACTWVHMAPGASAVKVVAQAPAGCEQRGEVEVSVKDSVVFYERNHLKVREELETLARNEAPGLGADTVQPVAPPESGAQRFIAWRCAR
jgi:hypothetical protein